MRVTYRIEYYRKGWHQGCVFEGGDADIAEFAFKKYADDPDNDRVEKWCLFHDVAPLRFVLTEWKGKEDVDD